MHPVLDNANTSSNVNSVTDNNLNDTPVNTNAILYFKQMKKTNTHVGFALDQTQFRENK
jgi:hypothetical protein